MNEEPESLDRRRFVRLALYSAAGACVGSLTAFGAVENVGQPKTVEELKKLAAELGEKFEWGFIVDTTRCIGCGSCVRACKLENKVPDSYFRTWVERYEIENDDDVHVDSPNGALNSFKTDQVGKVETDRQLYIKAFFVPKLCNHCRNSACTQVCPVGATLHSPDGVVLIDKKHCMGCGYCVQACPYGCRYINHEAGTADKCTLCYHRIHRGMGPACVEACPREARLFGNLKDPNSRIQKILHSRRYHVLKPDMGTNPKCHYLGLDKEVI